ncbi:MAG: glycosyltransferase family 2 protein [Aureliella sp.]
MPVATIIIPTRNRPDYVSRLLKRIDAQITELGEKGGVQVFVSDDSDGDDTKELIDDEFPDVRYLRGPKHGPGANRNSAAENSDTDWLIFVDDDCFPKQDWLVKYLEVFSGNQPGDRVCWVGATVRDGELPSLLYESPHNPEGISGITANFAISKRTYFEAGKINERFLCAFEDIEFFERCKAQQVDVQPFPQAVVLHPIRQRPGPARLAARWQGKVVFALDQGASPMRVLWNLPLHAALVIKSRFRGEPFGLDYIRGIYLFGAELMHVLLKTPFWLAHETRLERNQVWVEYLKTNPPVPKYGF